MVQESGELAPVADGGNDAGVAVGDVVNVSEWPFGAWYRRDKDIGAGSSGRWP
jgi:hypothetical protein